MLTTGTGYRCKNDCSRLATFLPMKEVVVAVRKKKFGFPTLVVDEVTKVAKAVEAMAVAEKVAEAMAVAEKVAEAMAVAEKVKDIIQTVDDANNVQLKRVMDLVAALVALVAVLGVALVAVLVVALVAVLAAEWAAE